MATTPQAKPYDGSAPLTAVISALKKFDGCEYRTAHNGWSRTYGADPGVSPIKKIEVQAETAHEYIKDVSLPMVEVSVRVKDFHHRTIAEGTPDGVANYLREFGYTVVETPHYRDGFRCLCVYGPGRDEWIEKVLEHRRLEEIRKAERKARLQDTRSQIDTILLAHGVKTPHWSEYDTTDTVTLTLEDLRKLTGADR